MVNNRIAILVTTALAGVCLGGVPGYRRRNTVGEVLRNQPRFVEEDRRIHDQFIYGHDDEPDYNDDVTGSNFNNDYHHSQFSNEFSSYNGEEPFNYQNPSLQEEDTKNLNEGSDFLNSFISNNMNSFGAEHQQHQQQSQVSSSNKNQGGSSSNKDSSIEGNDESSVEAEDQSEPSLREFTLLVSKLLFHLSQM